MEWWKKEKTIQIKILPFLQDQNKKESNNIIEDHTNKKKLGIQIKLKNH